MPRRGICDQSSTSPSGLSLERQRCLQHSLGLQWMGSHAWGMAWVVQGQQQSLCLLHAAAAHLPWHAPQPADVLLSGACKKGCYKRALLSRQAAVKDLPVELRTWEDRAPSLPSDFPAPSPGPEPASCLTPFAPEPTATCCRARSGWPGEQISSMLTIGFSLCFLLSQWVEIISVRQYSPRNCSIHTAVEAKSWECGQERAGRKRNSGK